ncbi:MAG: class I SAM-dependent methyltransferase [Candidatus Bathyarchaeota archaeon]|nr:MAG: class I SAM-dependent methyltransferase [Candidatus Bathyarchaeota archaeon]
MPKEHLSIEEIEDLGYYDFMGYMEVPFFNVGGAASIDRLAELCKIVEDTRVLNVGCGTGGNSCYLANRYGCTVVGIDIAEHMIEHARKRAEELGLTDRATFQVGDAYDLQFPDASFDAVITVFVSQFLDPGRAYPGFHRVLAPGGRLGINEMYRADEVPQEALPRVQEGEEVFREITELPFTLRSPTTWREVFRAAGFTDIEVEEHTNVGQTSASLGMVEEFGGWAKLAGTLWEMLVIALKSSKMRQRFGKISRGKRVLLRDKVASKYIGYILCAGRKP